jgi:hypothetical protein
MEEGESQITSPADWTQVSEILNAEMRNIRMRKEANRDDPRRLGIPSASTERA